MILARSARHLWGGAPRGLTRLYGIQIESRLAHWWWSILMIRFANFFFLSVASSIQSLCLVTALILWFVHRSNIVIFSIFLSILRCIILRCSLSHSRRAHDSHPYILASFSELLTLHSRGHLWMWYRIHMWPMHFHRQDNDLLQIHTSCRWICKYVDPCLPIHGSTIHSSGLWRPHCV